MLTQVTLSSEEPEAKFNAIADAAHGDVVIIPKSGTDITAKAVNKANGTIYYQFQDGTWNGLSLEEVDGVLLSLGVENSDVTVSEMEAILRENDLNLRVKSEVGGMQVTVSRGFAPMATGVAGDGELANTILDLVEKALEGGGQDG
jgi:hypothetical protein